METDSKIKEESNTDPLVESGEIKWPSDISKSPDEGPVQPHLSVYPKTITGTCKRAFCANWYDRFPWLEYSMQWDKAFCYACRHFGTQDPKKVTIYASRGFCKWGKAHDRLQRHNNSSRHLEAMEIWLDMTLRKEQATKSSDNAKNGNLDENLKDEMEEMFEYDEDWESPDEVMQESNTPPDKDSMLWCKCGKCMLVQDPRKCICCFDVDAIKYRMSEMDSNLCITQHPGFKSICLDPWVLQVAYYQHIQQLGEPSVTKDYERYRYIAYCQFVRWCWGYVEEDMQVPLSSCVVSTIKNIFKSTSTTHPTLKLPPSAKNKPLK